MAQSNIKYLSTLIFWYFVDKFSARNIKITDSLINMICKETIILSIKQNKRAMNTSPRYLLESPRSLPDCRFTFSQERIRRYFIRFRRRCTQPRKYRVRSESDLQRELGDCQIRTLRAWIS